MSSFSVPIASPQIESTGHPEKHGPHAHSRQGLGPASTNTATTPFAWKGAAAPATATAVDEGAVICSSSSPAGGYFGLVIDSSPEGPHAQHSLKNWSPAGSSIKSAAARSPRPVLVENPSTPFAKQVEVLGQKGHRPKLSLSGIRPVGLQPEKSEGNGPGISRTLDSQEVPDYFSSPTKTEAPAPSGHQGWANLSLPSVRHPPTPQLSSPRITATTPVRSSTLPASPALGSPGTISPKSLVELLDQESGKDLLLLDVRTYKFFSDSRITNSVNLCIPTTLLKRPSFTVGKLSETFANEKDRQRFGKWMEMKFIVVYDNDSREPTDSSALAAYHTLNKFAREGWRGRPYILKGGFAAFAAHFPDRIDRSPLSAPLSPKSLSLGGAKNDKPVGSVFNCPLPQQQSVVNPFFSNIRQNMDLIGGVGEIPIHLPQSMGSESIDQLPAWLKEVASNDRGTKVLADRFFKIEKAEQQRMQEALNVQVTYDSPKSKKPKGVSLAGVEKGAKNRYNNIWPYDHTRVKLQEYPDESCDYVNASYVQTRYSPKKYIASQAPLPGTFRDFWSMAWEQDIRVIVMLTAEQEGGQVKSHKYWHTDHYGPLKLTFIRERKVSLEPASLKGSPKRRSMAAPGQTSSSDPNVPHVIVRTLTLEHSGRPFSPMREITQLQYSSWPDFGAPAHPAHVLGLVEHTESVVRSAQGPSAMTGQGSTPSRHRPILVHCSAGCGRTGTFCTVDSVIGMLKRQQLHRKRQSQDDSSDGDGNSKMRKLGLEDNDDWVSRDDEDLVFKAVSEFRDQRISMVQSLRQFVLCYETVLEWWAKQSPLDSGKRKIP